MTRADLSASMRRGRATRRGQSGVSLLEVLIGAAVSVPLTLAAAMGLMVATRSSDAAETRQELEIALASASEDLKVIPYLPCGTVDDYRDAYRDWLEPLGDPVSATSGSTTAVVTAVSYWNRAKDGYVEACKGGDDGAQRLEVTVVANGTSATGTLVKRDGNARVGNSG
jgi:hypothetical protein